MLGNIGFFVFVFCGFFVQIKNKIFQEYHLVKHFVGPDLNQNCFTVCELLSVGKAQWLSGRVLDSRLRGCGFEPHRRHCVVVFE